MDAMSAVPVKMSSENKTCWSFLCSPLLVLSLQFSVFLYLLPSSTGLLLTPCRTAGGNSCGGGKQETV